MNWITLGVVFLCTLTLSYITITKLEGRKLAWKDFLQLTSIILFIFLCVFSIMNTLGTRSESGLMFFMYFIIAICWIYILIFPWYRNRSGSVLLDMGLPRRNYMSFLISLIWIYLGTTDLLDYLKDTGDKGELFSVLLNFTLAVMMILDGFNRFQLREKGLWLYVLLRWDRIESFHWEGDTLKLQIRNKTKAGTIRIDHTYIESVDKILRGKIGAQH